jgi:phosphoglycolate phosphatase
VATVPSPLRAVVFDLDGTLLDSYAAIHESLALVLAAFGRPPVTPDETRRMVGHGLESLVSRAVGEANVAEGIRIFRERYEKIGPTSSTLLPGADAVTARLRDAGIPLAIASNKPARFTREILEALGMASRFAFVAGPDDGFPPKPAPHMVLMALASLRAKASESVFVGDMPVDVATARAVPMPVVAVPSGSATEDELRSVSPDFLIRDLNELPGLLFRRIHT